MKHLIEIVKDRLRRPTLSMGAVLLALAIFLTAYVATGGHMFSPGALSVKTRANVTLGGVAAHADLANNCAACHASPWSGETMTNRCLECHADIRKQIDSHGPLHGKMSAGTQCRSCHTEHKGPHAALTSFASFDHDWAAFKLTGKHQAIDCKSCHVNNAFQGTPQSCVSCHAEQDKHKGKFGLNCNQCHSTNAWALTGGPNLANFNHDLTGFKLTGKHQSIDCRSCHVNDVFKGTSNTCSSCHAEPAVHKGRYGASCAQCHSTSAWTGAVIKHSIFSINHGRKNNSCATCHNDVQNFTSYTCYNCHQHTPAKEAQRHARRKMTTKLENCIDCHGRGKKRGDRAADGGSVDDLIAVCRLANAGGTGQACSGSLLGFGSFQGPEIRNQATSALQIPGRSPPNHVLTLDSVLRIQLPRAVDSDMMK